MSADDDGILGNLPRSRPGRRSARRDQPSAGAPPRPRPRPPEPEAPRDDAVGGAIRAAGQLAEAGIKAASQLAGGALSRLPRR